MTAHCMKDQCWFSAATCQDHEQTQNASKELLDWLRQQKIKNNLFVVPGPDLVSNLDGCHDHEEISDADLTSQLKEELVKSTGDTGLDVHSVPPGEGVFMFTILRGRNGEKIMTFIDMGANSIVLKDRIEKKLITVKLSDRPIPVSVAGGKEVMATGEWGALIPLPAGPTKL